ncbi:DUF4350 domain-containing protein [Schumannella sp. 10F1B-5-1]|uniref:DUF4350 domain-containing protein n=1 Tax=Schumannella sp. 10F1B-5-1 TaxID=2590780 RepID=UPI0011302F73|nr:DUF4350 domain-containing protein [Schumannella sp. 10F1B-5-1]TPW73583.1 DUF4350 domain-containing protein [Schumannella sp. 10F1B-5-1]
MSALQQLGDAEQQVLTPTVRARLRRASTWIGLVTVVLVLLLAGVLLARGGSGADPFSPDDASPVGSRALAQVLGQHGVDVRSAESLTEARDAAADPADTTLLVYDTGILDADQIADLPSIADRIVLVEPGFRLLNGLTPGVDARGEVSGARAADCTVPAVEKAQRVETTGRAYAADSADDSADVTARCLGSESRGYSLVQLERDGVEITVLGASKALQNDGIDVAGNAALTINLLGETDRLVWYRSGIADLPASATEGTLTPSFYVPLVLLLFGVALAAILWRGRRLGPLVVENLPVTVRASETMEGRARLYARSSARLRALDALRIGTVERLARAVGLPSASTVTEVVLAVADLVGRPPAEIGALLVDAEPRDDAELVRLSDRLLDLEREVAARLPH